MGGVPRDGANFATCVVFLLFLTRKGSGGGSKGFGSGGVGGRGTGPRDGANFATCVVFLLFLTRTKRRKIAFFEGCPVGWGGGTHRSWPGGRGGRPGALIPGEGVREGLAWQAKAEHPATELGGRGVREAGQGLGGGARASVPGGVGGRGTGPRDGANFATCVVFLLFLTRTKTRKIAFFEGCPVGWGGVPTGAGLVDGGVDQVTELAWWTGGQGGGARARRRKMFFFEGVVFLLFLTRTKRRKMFFFEGCPVGWGGGYPPELAWWTGG